MSKEEFFLQVFQRRIIEVELPFERAIGLLGRIKHIFFRRVTSRLRDWQVGCPCCKMQNVGT